MNITEIFNILVKPNIGHTVTIKNAKEGWFGKEFIFIMKMLLAF